MLLLERDRFADDLQRAAAAAREGHGGAVAVIGEAGIGKTALVEQVAQQLSGAMRVLRTGCEALFTPRPLGPVYDLASALGAEVDALLDADGKRERLFPAFLASAATPPSLLVVEDVHWADHATLDLLKYVVRRVARVPLLVVMTYRDDELSTDHPLTALLGDAPHVTRITLPRLSVDAVSALASTRGRDGRVLHALTGGNAFYVTELLASETEGVPPTVRDAVLARASKLSAAARAIVDAASVLPGRADRMAVQAALARELEDDAILEATTSGMISLHRDGFVFRHELGRRAVESALPEVRRQALHARVLQHLQQLEGISPARLAHHAAEAHDVDAIRRFAPLAYEEAVRADAHREAAAHARRLLANDTGIDEGERACWLERLSYECYLTQNEDEALACRRASLAIWRALGDRLREGDTLRWISRLQWFAGRGAEARAAAAEAIAILETLPPGPELAMAWSNCSQLHMLAQETDAAVSWGARAIELAARLGDQAILAHALNNVGTAETLAGRSGGAAKLDESLRISLAGHHQEHAARAYTNIGSGAVRMLDYARAETTLDEGIAWCTDRDLDAWRMYMLAWRARLRLERGQWNGAADDAHAVLAFRGGAAISRIPALAVLGCIRVRRDDPDPTSLLDEARALAIATGEIQRIAPVLAARAEAAWLRGDSPAELDDLRRALASAPADEPWARGELALALWRAGALDSAPSDVAEPYALHMAGEWRGAAQFWERAGRPWDFAAALAESDDADDLHHALSVLAGLGDRALSRKIASRLPQQRGPRPATRTNPHGLTSRELEIAGLLTEGLRNRDIAERLCVSPKTVDHHVSAVLAKLGARTRGEAAAKLRSSK